MSELNCNCSYRYSCSGIAVIASIIIGIITAFLSFSAVITLTPAFLWVLFGIAVVYLGILLITSAYTGNNENRRCICQILPTLLAGILGTILTSLILLGITFAATSVLGAVITGALLLFFTLTITSTVCLVKCVAGCSDR